MYVPTLLAVSMVCFRVGTTLDRLATFLMTPITFLILVPTFFSFMKLLIPYATITFRSCMFALLFTQAVYWLFLGFLHRISSSCCISRVFLSAISIAVVNSSAFLKSNRLSASSRRCILSSFTPHTITIPHHVFQLITKFAMLRKTSQLSDVLLDCLSLFSKTAVEFEAIHNT